MIGLKETNKIVRERIAILMQRADEVFNENQGRAQRYCSLARKIAMRYNIRMAKEWKRRICKNCYAFLKPGKNCRTRTREGKVLITCLECRNTMRIPFIKEKKESRRRIKVK